MDRVHRILRLIVLLQSQQGYGSRELMEQLGVSRRTLFRDLNMLELAGIPYHHEKGKGYRINQDFFLQPINLSAAETMGLMLMAKTTAARKNTPFGKAAISAVTKLIAMVPEDIRQTCQDLLSHVSVDHGAQLEQDEKEANHYIHLQQCIDEGRCCRITYRAPSDPEPQVMRLEAYAMHFASRAWYVIGYCDIHQEVRLLKLGRIVQIEMLERLFVRPTNFTVQDKIGKAWQLIPEGTIYDVELEFSARVASNVVETRWHASQKHRMLPNGRCRVTYEVDGLNEISWWICGYADQVEVISPPQLRQRVKQMLSRACQQYADDSYRRTPDVYSTTVN